MLDRLSRTSAAVTVTDAVATCEEISYGSYAGGFVFVPASSGITTLTFWVAEKLGGTYVAAYDQFNVPITLTVSNTTARGYALPTALYGAIGVKIVGDAAGTVKLSLKG